ncbi:MAG: HlyC/CorC family transporter [Syntrophobacteraceae bacterium]|nr:HlyC/CorC family transporter [Syntrophobacteraceae bacterium]
MEKAGLISGALEILVILALIAANGIFSMSEFAVISARKPRLQQLAEDGNPKAAEALELAGSPNLFLSTVQVGITLIGVLTGVFSGATIADTVAQWLSGYEIFRPFSGTMAFVLVVFLVTYFSLVFGELVPKRLALYYPEEIASVMAAPMRALSVIAHPVIQLLSISTESILKVAGIRPSKEPPVTEEEIKVLIEQATVAGVFDEAEKTMVQRVFRLGDRKAGVLMTPRKRVFWLDVNDSIEKIRRRISKSNYSRFPVIEGKTGRILGVVHVRDLLIRSLQGQPFDLQACLRPPLYIPEDMQVLKVLERFRESGMEMGLVIDEYGTVEGLITLNDILEAIIGDISSEDAREEPRIVQREDGSWLVDGMLPVDEFKELFHIKGDLPGEKAGYYQTLGGFVMTCLGRIPQVGDRFQFRGLTIEVVDMDGHRVDKLLVMKEESNGVERSSG